MLKFSWLTIWYNNLSHDQLFLTHDTLLQYEQVVVAIKNKLSVVYAGSPHRPAFVLNSPPMELKNSVELIDSPLANHPLGGDATLNGLAEHSTDTTVTRGE